MQTWRYWTEIGSYSISVKTTEPFEDYAPNFELKLFSDHFSNSVTSTTTLQSIRQLQILKIFFEFLEEKYIEEFEEKQIRKKLSKDIELSKKK